MIVQEVMTPVVVSIKTFGSVRQAAALMVDENIGALPVFDNYTLAGIITDRDILVRVIAKNFNPLSISVGQVMTKNPVTCLDTITIEQAALIMEQNHIRRLIAVNENNNLSGIVTVGDIARKTDSLLTGAMMRKIVEPAQPVHG